MRVHVTNRLFGERMISLHLECDANLQLHELLRTIHDQCSEKGLRAPIQFQFSSSGSDFESLTSLTYPNLNKPLNELFRHESIVLNVLSLKPNDKQKNLSKEIIDNYFEASVTSKNEPNKKMRQQYLKSRAPAIHTLNCLYSFFSEPIQMIIHEYWGTSHFLVIDVPPFGDGKTPGDVIAALGQFITNAFDVQFSENDVHHLRITTSVLLNYSSRSDFHDSLSLAEQKLAENVRNDSKSLQLVLHLSYNSELLGIYSNQYSLSKGCFEEKPHHVPCTDLYSMVKLSHPNYQDELKKSFVQYVLDSMIADGTTLHIYPDNPAKLKLLHPYYKWVRAYFLDNQTLTKFKDTDTLEDIITLAKDEASEARQMILSYLKKDLVWFMRQEPKNIKAALIQKAEIEFDLIENGIYQPPSPKLG